MRKKYLIIIMILLFVFSGFIQCKSKEVKKPFASFLEINKKSGQKKIELNDKILFFSFVEKACDCTIEKSRKMENEINQSLIFYPEYQKILAYEKIEFLDEFDLVQEYINEFNLSFPPAVVIIKDKKVLYKASDDFDINSFNEVISNIFNDKVISFK